MRVDWLKLCPWLFWFAWEKYIVLSHGLLLLLLVRLVEVLCARICPGNLLRSVVTRRYGAHNRYGREWC